MSIPETSAPTDAILSQWSLLEFNMWNFQGQSTMTPNVRYPADSAGKAGRCEIFCALISPESCSTSMGRLLETVFSHKHRSAMKTSTPDICTVHLRDQLLERIRYLIENLQTINRAFARRRFFPLASSSGGHRVGFGVRLRASERPETAVKLNSAL